MYLNVYLLYFVFSTSVISSMSNAAHNIINKFGPHWAREKENPNAARSAPEG